MSLILVWYHRQYICQLNANIFFLYYKPLLLPHLCLIKHKLHFLSFKIKFIRIYLCFSSGGCDSAWFFFWVSCTVYICVVVILFVFFTYITLTREKNISLQVGWSGGITVRMNRMAILYLFFPLFCLEKSNCRKIGNSPSVHKSALHHSPSPILLEPLTPQVLWRNHRMTVPSEAHAWSGENHDSSSSDKCHCQQEWLCHSSP